VTDLFRRATRSFACTPLDALLALFAIAVTLAVIAAPLFPSRYVPMVDLPFHAASGATFAHYADPSYHLKEQFTLHPLEVPYMSMYAIVAALVLVLPMEIAVKIAVACMLLLVPLGLAVLFCGAKKSPLLALLGLPLCWGNLTHWGFLNFVGALGLFAMAIGAAMLVIDRPTRPRRVGLALALVALFFTHIFRFPFAIAAVVGTAVVLWPAKRRVLPLALPLLPALLLFALWLRIHPGELDARIEIGFFPKRLTSELHAAITAGFADPAPARALLASFDIAWIAAGVAAIHALARRVRGFRRFTWWDAGVTFVPVACALVFLALFATLPLWIGHWWYVYPREATSAVLLLLAACPDLPRPALLRVTLVALIAAPAILVSALVTTRYAAFDAEAEDFYRITRAIPRGPRLFYLIVDREGTNRSSSPFTHMPAYVQAEKGGWLSWHFAIWNESPVRFRTGPGAVVAPRTPQSWEWAPEKFKLSMTTFFDWILVRQDTSPDARFAADETIRRVDHVGRWWLYARRQ
jgi:hypothetical protein